MSWTRYCQSVIRYPQLGFSIDFSRMDVDDAFVASMQQKIDKAFANIAALERGEIVNPDEQRMVGHYWLRNAALAPNEAIRKSITEPISTPSGSLPTRWRLATRPSTGMHPPRFSRPM